MGERLKHFIETDKNWNNIYDHRWTPINSTINSNYNREFYSNIRSHDRTATFAFWVSNNSK